jgi:uncharacterized protein (DUF2147 family)
MSIMKTTLAALALTTLLPEDVWAATEFNPNGTWRTERGQVRIFDCGSQKCGKIVGLVEPNDPETGKPKLDKKNEDPSLQSRPILNMQNLEGFSKDGENSWSGGTIYNPTEGKTYSSKMHMTSNNQLHVSGCVMGIFCKEQTWTRTDAGSDAGKDADSDDETSTENSDS